VSDNWSAATDWDTVCRRNAGRRHYNSVRAFQRAYRRKQVVELLTTHSLTERGTRAWIARQLGVSRSVITRDIQALLYTHQQCETCGSLVPVDRFERWPP
jgi:hypothetical protein